MKNSPYILSPDAQLPETEEINLAATDDCAEVQAMRAGTLFMLEFDDDAYLINATIRSFLQFFQTPHSLLEAQQHFARAANCTVSQIAEPTRHFFASMRKRRILVPAKKTDQAAAEAVTQARFVKDQIVLRYQIEQQIFSNKKIEIYKALDLATDEAVAIKILKRKQMSKTRRIRSFAQEFRILEDLGMHPNICRRIDYVATSEEVFGVLEYIDGSSMRSYLKKVQPDLPTKLHLLEQFFAGMAHIHRKDMLHGDLHMSNLLIQADQHLKIIDFNMSNRKTMHPDEIIREGGVHSYLAPEKIDARAFKLVNAPADFRSEVYQMGVIFYYLIFEHMPFRGFSWTSLAHNIMHQPASFAISTPQGEQLAPELLHLLQRMLAKKPNRRYKSAMHVWRKWKQLAHRSLQTTPNPVRL